MGDEVKWIRETAELEFDPQGLLVGGFGTAKDITDVKKIQETLEQSEAKYRMLIEAAPDGVVSLDAELDGGAWPMDAQWHKAARLAPLRDHRSGQISDVKTEVRLLQTREELLVRFDCQEPDQRPLRVVTREEEIASRGADNRGVNWLDRRESFGPPDWGETGTVPSP